MPTETCKKCGETVSFSKLDKLEKIHKCRKNFRDSVITKPALSVEEKDADREQDTEDINVETSHFNFRTGAGRQKKVQD